MYLHQKMIRIYADIVQNHTLPGVFPNFWRAVYNERQQQVYLGCCLFKTSCMDLMLHMLLLQMLN